MKQTSPVKDKVVLSDVQSTGSFKIKTTAKAFKILSSSLYANKHQAIVRELSTNAYDSHVARGTPTRPFDIHLPTTLEPWFSVRDYGIGLTLDQVTSIYTTYFESTKEESNDFVGCLGLGSKSPFSYTDNFTVTAIKDGIKGMFSAFIDDQGVPGIALLQTSPTEEEPGLEVKFAVENRNDNHYFTKEAERVLPWFAVTPNVNITIQPVKYESRDICPGVHQLTQSGSSLAYMGNVVYPIDSQILSKHLDSQLVALLNCGLLFDFSIGELEFQPSREGLSYIPETIKAIETKLQHLNSVLLKKFAEEANSYTNKWEQFNFLRSKKDNRLWSSVVAQYAMSNPNPFWKVGTYSSYVSLDVPVQEVADQFNIRITAFSKSNYDNVTHEIKETTTSEYDSNTKSHIYKSHYSFNPTTTVIFVENDTPVGGGARAKWHWKNTPRSEVESKCKLVPHGSEHRVYVLEKNDKTKPMLVKEFLEYCYNPLNVMKVSELKQKPRAIREQADNFPILKLEKDTHLRDLRWMWRPDNTVDKFPKTETYYYLPLKGYEVISKSGKKIDAKELTKSVYNSGFLKIKDIQVKGVRKADLPAVEKMKNWVNFETFLETFIKDLTRSDIIEMMFNQIDPDVPTALLYVNESALDEKSPIRDFVQAAKDFKLNKSQWSNRTRYMPKTFISCVVGSKHPVFGKIDQAEDELINRYSMLQYLSGSKINPYNSKGEEQVRNEVTKYIQQVDKSEGV